MKIVVACIYLGLVACTRGQATSSQYHRVFNIDGSRQRVHRRAGGGGFNLPESSGGGAGSSKFQNWGASVNSLGRSGSASAFSLPRPNKGANSFSLPVSNLGARSYGASASRGGSGSLRNQGVSRPNDGNNFLSWGTAGGLSNQGSSGSNHQRRTTLVDRSGGAGASSLPGSVGHAGAFNVPVGSLGAGNYRMSSTSGGAGAIKNQGGIRGMGSSKYQGWGAGASNLPEPIGSAGSLNPSFASYTAPSTRGLTGGSTIQGGNRIGSNYQRYRGGTSSNQGGNGGGSGSSFQGNSARARNSNYQGNNGRGTFQDNSASASDVSYQVSYGGGSSQDNSASASVDNYQVGYEGGTSQDYSGGSSSVSEYQAIPQTFEGENVDPELLQQIRTILLKEENAYGSGGETADHLSSHGALGVPSSAYGAPITDHSESNRISGITFEGIDQSFLIAEFHETMSGSGSLGHDPYTSLVYPSSHYGAPY